MSFPLTPGRAGPSLRPIIGEPLGLFTANHCRFNLTKATAPAAVFTGASGVLGPVDYGFGGGAETHGWIKLPWPTTGRHTMQVWLSYGDLSYMMDTPPGSFQVQIDAHAVMSDYDPLTLTRNNAPSGANLVALAGPGVLGAGALSGAGNFTLDGSASAAAHVAIGDGYSLDVAGIYGLRLSISATFLPVYQKIEWFGLAFGFRY